MTAQTVSPPARLAGHAVGPGRPWPMGASLTGDGVNFAVFSAHAGGRTRENFDRIVRHWSVNIRRLVSGAGIDPACLVTG